MTAIRHIVEPTRLVLSWQPAEGTRSRLAVGEIFKRDDIVTFRYLMGTPEFDSARSAGFQGYPAFGLTQEEHTRGVLDTFLTRLPSRSRGDFPDFLKHHRLPDNTLISDFSLLGYTTAKLPSDSFELIPLFDDDFAELELILEACGFRHQNVDPTALRQGAPIEFGAEPNNPHDPNAVAMLAAGQKIGYVNRILSPTFSRWLQRRPVSGQLDRINGRAERPLVYVFTEIRNPVLIEAN